GGDIFNGGGTSRRRPWGGDLLLGHGEDELALGAVRHGRLDDVADAGRGQREVARVDERLEGPRLHELGERPHVRRHGGRVRARQEDLVRRAQDAEDSLDVAPEHRRHDRRDRAAVADDGQIYAARLEGRLAGHPVVVAAHGVKNDIQLQPGHRRDDVLLLVVDDGVRAEALDQVDGRARGVDVRGAEGLGDLHGEASDTATSAQDGDLLALLQLAVRLERLQGGEAGQGQGRGLLERNVLGHAAQRRGRDQRVLGEGSGRLDRVGVDAVAHLERVAAGPKLRDGAAHVAAERTRLLPGKVPSDELVVDRVDRGARDLDEDLIRRRLRHRGVVDHREYVRRRRIAVLVLDCGLHGFVLDSTLNT
ncbi:unnamed protein product, partial [Pelagomonas calceolata]